MGFYSFYRIIKDIIRTIFGNRVFRLVLIACVCGFLLCFVSDKVQASYVSDTNGFFDNTTFLQENQTTFTISNINCTIPLSYYNYSTILIKPYFANGSITRIYSYYTNGDLKYDFSSNKFYSTDTLYRVQCNVSSNIANFNNINPTEYNGSSGVNALYVAGNTYNSFLLGSIYDNSNDNLIISSISQPVSSSIPVDFADARNNFSITLGGQTITLPAFVFSYKYLIVTHRVSNEWGVYFSDNLLCYANNTSSNNNNVPFHYILGTRDYLENGANNNSELNKFYYLNSNDANLANPNLSSYKLSDFTVVTTALYDAQTSPELNNNYYTATFDISTVGGDILYESDGSYLSYQPFFEPSASEIQSLEWTNIYVELGDFNINENNLYIHRLEVSRTVVGTGAQDPISYYYNDNIILLEKGNKYWKRFGDSDKYYFSVPMSQFDFKPEKAYFLVLTDNPSIINNSLGVIDKGYYASIFQIVEINSGNLITIDDVINNNIEKMGDDVTFLGRTIEESLSIGSENNKQLTEETNTNIDTNLNFNNQNSSLNNLNNGFFSRLTNLIRNLLGYNLSEDTTINIPYPNSNKNLELHSNIIYSNLSPTFQALISSFWFFVFGFYMWRFINKIYIAVSTGHILDTFSSSGEAITNDML